MSEDGRTAPADEQVLGGLISTRGKAAGYAELARDLGIMLTADGLRQVFPDWRIWHAGTGRWLASRPGTVAMSGPQSLIHPVVIATSLTGLAEQLEVQDLLRRMSATELEAVWREGFTAYKPEPDDAPDRETANR